MSWRPFRRSAALFAFTVALGLTAACSGSSPGGDAASDPGSDEPRLVAQTPGVATTLPEAAADGVTDPAAEPGAESVLEGRVVNPYDLNVGECFNEYVLEQAEGGREEITTVVDCRSVHDGEVYHQFVVPGDQGAPYPGDAELREASQAECYDRFEAFVGSPYEVSALGIGILHPTFETWTGPGIHREVTCYVEPYDDALRLEGGSVAGRGL